MKKLTYLSLIAAFLLMSVDSEAQRFSSRKKYWSLGGSINAMNFVGDVTGSKNPASVDFSFTRPNLSVCAVRRMAPRVSVRGNLFWGRLRGNDRKSSKETQDPDFGRWHRGVSFRNDIIEVSGTVIVDFFENRGTFLKRPDYTPYAFAGLAGLYHNPVVSKDAGGNGNWMAGKTDSKLTGALLYGLGFRYKLDKQWDIALEIGWRKTFTDWLDGVSGERGSKVDDSYYNDLDFTMDFEDDFLTSDAAKNIIVIYDPDGDGLNASKVGNLYALNQSGQLNSIRDNPSYYTHQSRVGEQFGDDKTRNRKDGYIVTGIHVTYILSGGVKCPKFR